MAMVNQFVSNLPSCKYIFTTGKVAHFVQGIYRTADKKEVAELTADIEAGHPHISFGAERLVDTAKLDPMAALREKIIAEYVANEKAATNTANDMGTEGASRPASPAGMQTSAKVVVAASSNSK